MKSNKVKMKTAADLKQIIFNSHSLYTNKQFIFFENKP